MWVCTYGITVLRYYGITLAFECALLPRLAHSRPLRTSCAEEGRPAGKCAGRQGGVQVAIQAIAQESQKCARQQPEL